MDGQHDDAGRLREALEQLRGDLARLESRIAQLERGAAGTAVPPPAEDPDAIDAETMMAIAAAIAAYLGKKPHIRSIRLLRSDTWAQEGRATIQAWYSVSPPHHR